MGSKCGQRAANNDHGAAPPFSSAWEETAHAHFGVPEFGHFALVRPS
jgi:hypothetical protein